MEGYNDLIQNLTIFRKDIIECYEEINKLVKAQDRLKDLYENTTVMDSISKLFEKLNSEILKTQKAWQYYTLERDSIIEIEENEKIYSLRNSKNDSKYKSAKRNETRQRLIEYHSNMMGKSYIDYLNKEKSKLKLTKEVENSMVSLFNLIQTIYPNFNKNNTFINEEDSRITFEEKAANITDSCFTINSDELIRNLFVYAINQTNNEIEEKRSTIINLLLGEDQKENITNNNRSLVLKKQID